MKIEIPMLTPEDYLWAASNRAVLTEFGKNVTVSGRLPMDIIFICFQNLADPSDTDELVGKYFIAYEDHPTDPTFIELQAGIDLADTAFEEYYLKYHTNFPKFKDTIELTMVAYRDFGTANWVTRYATVAGRTNFTFVDPKMKPRAPAPAAAIPKAKKPQMPVEVHNDTPIDPAAIWEAHKSHKF